MKLTGQARMVMVSCANRAEAERIARVVVGKRLAACVNIWGGPVDSIYRWKGRVEKAREALMIFKTTEKRLAGLQREVKRLHSYEVPEFVAMPIVAGSREYLSWVRKSVEMRS